LRKKLLRESRLYLILDKKITAGQTLAAIVKKIKKPGLGIIQLRNKQANKKLILAEARQLRKMLEGSKILFIVNDHPDIARAVDSDGVHLGQGDMPPGPAKEIVGKGKIIGVSCHSLKQALRAQREGADYIGLGPIFPTATKTGSKPIGLRLIKKLRQRLKIPFFVLGGINQENIKQVLSAGAKRIALASAVLGSKDIASSLKSFSRLIKYDAVRIR